MSLMFEVTNTLLQNKFQAFLVGGYLRDCYLDRIPHDADFATNATPDQVEEIFSKIPNIAVINAGKEFGTVAILNNKEQIEITTYRKDIKTDGRKAVVEFSDSIEEDLARRDFTMNALALNLQTYKLLDLFGAKEDIQNRIVKAIGNSYDRFKEDHLRMLRACRFMALDLTMTLHPDTKDAITDLSPLINTAKGGKVTIDRQREELLKGMSYPFPSRMIETMKTTGLLKIMIPELYDTIGVTQNKHHNIYKHKGTGQLYILNKNNKFEELL